MTTKELLAEINNYAHLRTAFVISDEIDDTKLLESYKKILDAVYTLADPENKIFLR